MSQHLYGIHDANQDWPGLIRDFGVTGWAVISEEIGDQPTNQSGVDYRWLAAYGVTPIVRLNYSHHGEGTIPLPSRYNVFAERCANFVTASNGCRHWLIGNEPNLRAERYGDVPITPGSYAECFNKCRLQIKQRGTQHNVIPAAIAPYNADTGWCLDYWREMLSAIVMTDGGADGLALHTYSRGPNPNSITSEDKMEAYPECYNGFRAYRDFLALVPAIMRALPVYITETDQLEPWADRNSGWVAKAYDEIDEWNQGGYENQGIHCLALYRWENFDQWGFCRKNGVIDDFRGALTLGYQTPLTPPTPTPPDPEPPRPTPAPEPEPIDWDKRLAIRGCTLQPALLVGDDQFYERVSIGRWFDKDEAQGRVSVYVRLLDENGQLAIGVPVTWFWSSGSETKLTERKSDPWLESKGLGREYSLDFAMYEVAPSYGIRIDSGNFGDIIDGCGLGSIEQPDYKIHTAYFFEWQLSSEGITVPVPPTPTPPATARELLWPVVGPISQPFGDPPALYGQIGHNGIDIAVAEGTPVLAVTHGEVMMTGWDDSGYGNYVRVWHPSINSHSMLAHLSEVNVRIGDMVEQGHIIALSGNTGNSTGPHLHYEMRGGTRDGYYEGLCYGYTKGRYDPRVAYLVTGSPLTPGAER